MTYTLITIENAIAQGYTHAGTIGAFGEGEGIISELSKLKPADFEDSTWILCEKETRKFTIADNLLLEMVQDHILNQDEVSDKSEDLHNAVATVDFSDITQKLNEAFSKYKYYEGSGFQLIPITD